MVEEVENGMVNPVIELDLVSLALVADMAKQTEPWKLKSSSVLVT